MAVVKVFGLENCANCAALVRFLEKKGVELEYTVMGSEEISDFKAKGFSQAPITEISGELFSFEPVTILRRALES